MSWYIERENGDRISGPYTTRDDALRARSWVERVMDPETFWVRDETGNLQPPELEPPNV